MDLLEKKVDFGLVTIHIIRNIFFVVETGHYGEIRENGPFMIILHPTNNLITRI